MLTFVDEVIHQRPRKPFSGCLLFNEFEFIIVLEPGQKDNIINVLLRRFGSIRDIDEARQAESRQGICAF